MKKGIIFDMDGTLWDSAANVAESWNLAIKQDGSVDKKLTEQDIQGVMGKTMDVIADILFPEMEKEARMKLLDQCCSMENDYLREHGGVLYPKLEETLSALKEKYPLYIVSNCQSGYIEAFLDHYGFRKYFEDIECYGNNLKQKGDNIRLLADRNGLTEAVYVGDIQGIMTPAATQVSGSSTQHMGLEQLQRTCRKSIHLRNLQRQQTNILLCGKKL